MGVRTREAQNIRADGVFLKVSNLKDFFEFMKATCINCQKAWEIQKNTKDSAVVMRSLVISFLDLPLPSALGKLLNVPEPRFSYS